MNLRPLPIAIMLLPVAAVPAAAAQCILDYEAFVIRSALPDEASIIDEQSASGADWYVNGDRLRLIDFTYEKYGLPRIVFPSEIEFHAFVGSVPFFREAGAPDTPPSILYASVSPLDCEVQPYQLVD